MSGLSGLLVRTGTKPLLLSLTVVVEVTPERSCEAQSRVRASQRRSFGISQTRVYTARRAQVLYVQDTKLLVAATLAHSKVGHGRALRGVGGDIGCPCA